MKDLQPEHKLLYQTLTLRLTEKALKIPAVSASVLNTIHSQLTTYENVATNKDIDVKTRQEYFDKVIMALKDKSATQQMTTAQQIQIKAIIAAFEEKRKLIQ